MLKIRLEKGFQYLLSEKGIQSPPQKYCPLCGTICSVKLKKVDKHWDQKTGARQWTLKAIYSCPKWQHRLPIIRFFQEPYPEKWDDGFARWLTQRLEQ